MSMDRRTLLRGAGLLGLDTMFTAERTDAAAVGPNDVIKVTKLETFVLKNSWVFVSANEWRRTARELAPSRPARPIS